MPGGLSSPPVPGIFGESPGAYLCTLVNRFPSPESRLLYPSRAGIVLNQTPAISQKITSSFLKKKEEEGRGKGVFPDHRGMESGIRFIS